MKNPREEIEHLLVAMQDGNMARRMVIDELLSLFRQAMEEVVGEDEEQPNWREAEFSIIGRKNQLRAEQRARSNKIMPKE